MVCCVAFMCMFFIHIIVQRILKYPCRNEVIETLDWIYCLCVSQCKVLANQLGEILKSLFLSVKNEHQQQLCLYWVASVSQPVAREMVRVQNHEFHDWVMA